MKSPIKLGVKIYSDFLGGNFEISFKMGVKNERSPRAILEGYFSSPITVARVFLLGTKVLFQSMFISIG